MKPTYQVRQGDVYLIRVSALPETVARTAVAGNYLLALGEATGHAHYVREQEGILFEPTDRIRRIAEEFGITDTRSVIGGLRITMDEATLYHGTPTASAAGPQDADHAPITLPVGDYVVVQPREFDDSEDFRRVAD